MRTERYRYIRYRTGSEELYDHVTDPHEWNNLAGTIPIEATMARLRRWTYYEWANAAPSKKAFTFDPETFTWTHKETGERITASKLDSQLSP